MDALDYQHMRATLQAVMKAIRETDAAFANGLAPAIRRAAPPQGGTAKALCEAMAHTLVTGEVTDVAKPFEPGGPF